MLPAPDIATSRDCRELAEHAAWIMASCDAALLCVQLGPAERSTAEAVVPWRRDLTPDHDLARTLRAPGYRYRAMLDRVERTAESLFARLCLRWPPYAPPRRLGVITDGVGVGFSPDDPCPLAPGWLARQTRRSTRLTLILPFARPGVWSVLDDEAASITTH